MSKEEIRFLLSTTLPEREEPLNVPSPEDWDGLRNKFHCDFPQAFIHFMEVVPVYRFPMELYDVVQNGRTDGNGAISTIYDQELAFNDEPSWDPDLIPFAGLGNGDCFCLRASKGNDSPVYYVYHEDGHSEELYQNFQSFLLSWIKSNKSKKLVGYS